LGPKQIVTTPIIPMIIRKQNSASKNVFLDSNHN
jgi:hypothetical protein